jgi:hypothetical protein
LKLRRFLDGMRIRSSFDSTARTLSQSQENFKYWADNVRSLLSKIPGMQQTMSDYAFNIQALEAIARDAARRGNNQIIGLIDSIFLGSAALGQEPAIAATVGILRRMATDPRTATNLAQWINKSGNLTRTGVAIKTMLDQMLKD